MPKAPANPPATHASLSLRVALALTALLLLLFAWVAAGPWIAMRGIQNAVENKDLAGLARHIDFDKLRPNLQAQMEDVIARQIANRGGLLGGAATGAASMVAKKAAEGMVSPAGIAILLEGDALVKRAQGNMKPGSGLLQGGPKTLEAFKNAKTRYVSVNEFEATVTMDETSEVDFVFEREGFRWKLANIRLPHPKTAP